MSTEQFLEDVYREGMEIVGMHSKIVTDLKKEDQALLETIISNSENAKGVLTVILTSLTYKFFNPKQDIRNHQVSIAGGYSGRSFDARYITPFMKAMKFPAMAESGWLTRALEQKVPYDKNYPGAMTPKELKPVFLEVIDKIQRGADCRKYLSFLIQGLIIKRNAQSIDLAKPVALSIHTILKVLDKHFGATYKAEGVSRLPVLAIYAAYECLIHQVKRFEGKELLKIEIHTSSDKSSGMIGDVQVIDEKKKEFEAVEVKFGIPVSLQIVKDAYTKFSTTTVDRYYILSTADTAEAEMTKIDEEIQKIKNVHGCQVIVNGIRPTIKYYLRLLENTAEFVECYVNLLEADGSLKFEHKEMWNKIISELD